MRMNLEVSILSHFHLQMTSEVHLLKMLPEVVNSTGYSLFPLNPKCVNSIQPAC